MDGTRDPGRAARVAVAHPGHAGRFGAHPGPAGRGRARHPLPLSLTAAACAVVLACLSGCSGTGAASAPPKATAEAGAPVARQDLASDYQRVIRDVL
ncbi:hypothetical protein [Streptomyces sp. NPDC055287]